MTQFSTTKSKSILVPGSKLKLSPKPLHSYLKSEIFTTNQIINMYSEHALNISQLHVTERNRRQRFSTWLARQQRKHFSQDWAQGESKHTIHSQRDKTSLSKGSTEPLVPAKWRIVEAIDCLSQSQDIFRSQIQPTLEIRRWVNVQRISPLVCRITIAAQESCLQVSTFQQRSLNDNPLQNC